MQFSVVEMWTIMGPIAKAVVVLLTLMSLLSLATAAEKWVVLRRATRESTRFLAAWRQHVLTAGVAEAGADTKHFTHSPVAHVIAAGTDILAGDLAPDAQREAYDRTVRRAVLAAGSSLRRGMSIIATVGSTAPFVGLVGTVVGIVNAFQQLAASGQGGVGQVSAGIAEALVTTAIGIGVAIPAVWLFNHLTQWVGRLLVEMECAAEELAVAALGESRRPPISTRMPDRAAAGE
ncbi:MAG TPA: MotA/TolQ/ExbB proton channel family protein [Candidatus Margulisiibacteriota bacterium]|nr:MotA/TolQ/ExbB proton channel family protein [Candidatus Margulisiibacteriota bacterium]